MALRKERNWPIVSMAATFAVALFAGIVFAKDSGLKVEFSALALVPLFSIIVNLYLLVSIVRRRQKIKSILWFSIFLVALVFWAIADLISFTAVNSQTGLFARAFVGIPALIGAPALYVFIKDTTSRRPENLISSRVAMFANTFFYLVILLSTSFIFLRDPNQLTERFWGYELEVGSLGFLYILWSQVIIIISCVALFRYYRSIKNPNQKKQARIYLISILIPIIGISCTNLIPSLLGLSYIPVDSLYLTFMAVFMLYGINKYQLFSIDPTQISNNILETMAESVVVTDLKFRFQYANGNGKKMFGFSEDSENLDKGLDEFLSAEDFKRLGSYGASKKVIKDSKNFSDMEVRSGGKYTPVDISMSSISSDGEKKVGYVFVLSDVSSLQKAYSKLAEQEKKVEQQVVERTEQLYAEHAKLQASISGLPIGFIMLDEHMKIIEQNKVAQELFSTRENNRWYVEDALEEMGVERDLLKKSRHGEIVDIPEVKRGSRILHIIISPIIRDEKKLGSVVLIEDITSQKVAEKERNEFIVTASHEIRTPLSIIQGNLSNALDMPKEISSTATTLVEKAYDASNHINALFNDILIVSDIENVSSPKPKFETIFDISLAAQEVYEKIAPIAEPKGLNLKLNKLSGAKVKADRDEIKEAIFKLVDNAVKFTKKGSVEVKLSKKGGDILVRVTDTGKGISQSEEKRLFKKFVRLDNSLKREAGGTGLGLYIAKALAERNGGSLILEKSSTGGSTFCLSLPAEK